MLLFFSFPFFLSTTSPACALPGDHFCALTLLFTLGLQLLYRKKKCGLAALIYSWLTLSLSLSLSLERESLAIYIYIYIYIHIHILNQFPSYAPVNNNKCHQFHVHIKRIWSCRQKLKLHHFFSRKILK